MRATFPPRTQEVDRTGETTYYDSVSGLPLFVAPRGRSFASFEAESRSHGWPSFRDEEVIWDNVRCLPDGEAVSLAGTHLGHNLPDRKGNRYCACTRGGLFARVRLAVHSRVRALTQTPCRPRAGINLVSVAGNPAQ